MQIHFENIYVILIALNC